MLKIKLRLGCFMLGVRVQAQSIQSSFLLLSNHMVKFGFL